MFQNRLVEQKLLLKLKLIDESINLNLNNNLDNLNNKRNNKKVLVSENWRMMVIKWLELDEIPSFTNRLMRLPPKTYPPSDRSIKTPDRSRKKTSTKLSEMRISNTQY